VPVLLAALVAAGCASSGTAPPTAPELGERGPPPAWIETAEGSRRLAFSSYCWRFGDTGLCADYVQRSCGKKGHPPIVRVVEGEAVRFHLGYEPSEVSVNMEGIDASREPEWRVTHDGALALFTKGSPGDASYVACLQFTGST